MQSYHWTVISSQDTTLILLEVVRIMALVHLDSLYYWCLALRQVYFSVSRQYSVCKPVEYTSSSISLSMDFSLNLHHASSMHTYYSAHVSVFQQNWVISFLTTCKCLCGGGLHLNSHCGQYGDINLRSKVSLKMQAQTLPVFPQCIYKKSPENIYIQMRRVPPLSTALLQFALSKTTCILEVKLQVSYFS